VDRPRGPVKYAKKKLRAVQDSALQHGFSTTQEARFPQRELGAEQTGMSFLIVKPAQREALAHLPPHRGGDLRRPCGDRPRQARRRARRAGPARSGRVSPGVARCFQAAPAGLRRLIFGAHVESDGEMVHDFWGEWSQQHGVPRSRPLRGWRRLVPSFLLELVDRHAQRWLGHVQPLSRA
jgi:hypothetical protein